MSVPLLQRLKDNWRARESTDLSIMILKLALLHKVLKIQTTTISDLYPACPANLRKVRVKVPKKNFEVHELRAQVDKADFLDVVAMKLQEGHWALLGVGNDAAVDSWLVLEKEDSTLFILQIQSKKRAGTSPSLTSASLAEEAAKAYRVPKQKGTSAFFYVTDQPLPVKKPLKRPYNPQTIVIDPSKHQQFYASAYPLKVALQE